MEEILDVAGGRYDDIAEFLDEVIENELVVRLYYDEPNTSLDGEAYYILVLGYTLLENDLLIHYVYAEDDDLEGLYDAAMQGTSFGSFNAMFMTKHGFDIIAMDQPEYIEKPKPLCDSECMHCTREGCVYDDDEDDEDEEGFGVEFDGGKMDFEEEDEEPDFDGGPDYEDEHLMKE